MLRNYLTTTLRHFRKYRGYTAINLAGLTAGISCTLLILLWVADELQMDKFHDKGSRTYLLLRNMHLSNGDVITTPAIPQPVRPLLEADYPDVESVALISWENESLFRYKTQAFKEKGRYVSPSFLDIFSFQLSAGDPKTALADVHSLMVSTRLATKYFGSPQLAIGQIIRIDDRQDFTVTGVFMDPGPHSSLQFDWLIPDQEYIARNDWVESWFNGGFSIVCVLKPGADEASFAKRIEQEINVHTNNAADERLIIQEFGDRYLHGTFDHGINTGGRIDYLIMLSIVALFTLVVACVNFMNLSTAQSSRRAKEIGMRKAMGAQRAALSWQFLTEAVVLSVGAVVLSAVVVLFMLPYFNALTGKEIILDFASATTWSTLIIAALIVGLLAGSYPAFVLPGSVSLQTAKGSSQHIPHGRTFRKALVIFQFSVSILLIVGTVAVYRQLDYILNKNLGLDKSNVVLLELEGELASKHESFKAELQKLPGVEGVALSSGNPLSYGRSSSSPAWEGKDPDEEVEMNIMMVDYDFLSTMKVGLTAGRAFSEGRADSANYVINERAASIMGFKDPVGQALTVWGVRGEIIGVVKDFHMASLYEPIAPLILRQYPSNTQVALVRISGNVPAILASIEKLARSFNPALPFSYQFLDETYIANYRAEQIVSILVAVFSAIAIFISCLGLLGLCSFSAELRRKELGIRRVHGATKSNLIFLMSSEYAVLVLAAFIVSAPLAWYTANEWLGRFAFRTSLGIADLLLAAAILVLVAGATVALKSFQAASANPTETLREQ